MSSKEYFHYFWRSSNALRILLLNRCFHFAVKAFWWTRDVCCLHLLDAYVEDISARVSLNLVRSGHLPAANRRGTCEEGVGWLKRRHLRVLRFYETEILSAVVWAWGQASQPDMLDRIIVLSPIKLEDHHLGTLITRPAPLTTPHSRKSTSCAVPTLPSLCRSAHTARHPVQFQQGVAEVDVKGEI
jgi:hypothetical protein